MHRRSQDFLWGALFSSESLTTLFIIVVLNAQAQSAKLTTPTLQLSLAQQKFPKQFDFWLCLGVYFCLKACTYNLPL